MLKIIQSTKEEIVLQLSFSEEKCISDKDRDSELMKAFFNDFPSLLCGKLIENDFLCSVKETESNQFIVKALDGCKLPTIEKFQKIIDATNEEIRMTIREIALENFRIASGMSKKAIASAEPESISTTTQLIKLGIAPNEPDSHHSDEMKAEQSVAPASNQNDTTITMQQDNETIKPSLSRI